MRTPSPCPFSSSLAHGAVFVVLTACPPSDDDATLTSATEATASTTTTSGSASTTTAADSTSTASPATETTDAPTTSTSTATDVTTTTATSSTDTTTTDASTTTSADTEGAACGDGHVDAGEECDLGADNDNFGACTKLCQLPECGDGLQQPGEECDLGPANHPSKYGGCTPECTLGPHCGDGNTDKPDEACDPSDPNLADPATCDACQWSAKLVFVSSSTHTGALGGHTGADKTCQTLASAAGLTSKGQAFRAWLSDNDKAAAQHLVHASDPYILVDGTLVATDWNDLTDGHIAHPISLDEQGQPVAPPHQVWTGTLWNGTLNKPGSVCANWSVPTSDHKGTMGWSQMDTVEWTDAQSFGEPLCTKMGRIYCFQQ